MQAGRSTLALVEMPLIAKNTYAPVASATNFMVGSRAQPPFKRLPLRARANRGGKSDDQARKRKREKPQPAQT